MRIAVQVIGGTLTEVQLPDHESITVSEFKAEHPKYANYQATVKGEVVSDDDEINDDDIVVFSERIKGA